jgi:hypothetical protein
LTYTALSEVNLVLSAQHGLCLACGPRNDANAPQSANAEMPYLFRASQGLLGNNGEGCIMQGNIYHERSMAPCTRDTNLGGGITI